MSTEHTATTAAVEAERRAIDADIAPRRAKAEKFIELVADDGVNHPQVWKTLDRDPALCELERHARYAGAEARAAWLEAQRHTTEEET